MMKTKLKPPFPFQYYWLLITTSNDLVLCVVSCIGAEAGRRTVRAEWWLVGPLTHRLLREALIAHLRTGLPDSRQAGRKICGMSSDYDTLTNNYILLQWRLSCFVITVETVLFVLWWRQWVLLCITMETMCPVKIVIQWRQCDLLCNTMETVCPVL